MPFDRARLEHTRRNRAACHRGEGQHHDRQTERNDQETVDPVDPAVAIQRQGAGEQYCDREPPGGWNPQ
ncbi:hypothetical protein D3C80_1507270 [compost metagenome]